jgi:hypothetical protein
MLNIFTPSGRQLRTRGEMKGLLPEGAPVRERPGHVRRSPPRNYLFPVVPPLASQSATKFVLRSRVRQ